MSTFGEAESPVNPAEQAVPRSWSLYFPEEDYTAEDRRSVLFHELLPRLAERAEWLANRLRPGNTTGRHRLSLSVGELESACRSSELSMAIDLQPAEALACVGAAAHQVCRYCKPEMC